MKINLSSIVGKNKGEKEIKQLDIVLFKKNFTKTATQFLATRQQKFEVDSFNRSFLKHFSKYWTNSLSFEINDDISLNKGLYVFGPNGTGKTTNFEIIQEMSKRLMIRQLWFPSIPAEDVVTKFNVARNREDIIKYYSEGIFLFDDLGAEPSGNNIFQYGKVNVFRRILLNRYRNFEQKGTKTHITTNLNYEQIGKKYGEEVKDRFYRMFNVLVLKGETRRVDSTAFKFKNI